MDIGSFFLILALFILVGLYISRPFFDRRKARAVTQQDHDLSALLAEKERTLTSLQELEFDFVLGKIPEEIYPTQRAALVQRGAELLQQIDGFAGQAGGVKAENAVDKLEAAVAARRAAQGSAIPAGTNGGNHADDPVEAMIAARRRTRQEKAAGFCHQCGSPLQQSDRFCPKCGTLVK